MFKLVMSFIMISFNPLCDCSTVWGRHVIHNYQFQSIVWNVIHFRRERMPDLSWHCADSILPPWQCMPWNIVTVKHALAGKVIKAATKPANTRASKQSSKQLNKQTRKQTNEQTNSQSSSYQTSKQASSMATFCNLCYWIYFLYYIVVLYIHFLNKM